MGVWGTEIMHNDVAREVEGQFVGLVEKGSTAEGIVNGVLGAFEVDVHREREEDFWMPTLTDVYVYTSLAHLLLEKGFTHAEVFQDALTILELEGDLEQWVDTDDYEAREKAFVQLKEAIETAMQEQ